MDECFFYKKIHADLHEWFPPYSGTYFPRLVNLLAQKGIDITKDNSLVVLTTGVYLSAAGTCLK